MTSAHAPAARPFFTPGTLLLVAVAVVGWAFGFARLLTGLGPVTNLSDSYPWGIWIAIDVACGVALAAGGFTTAALVEIFGRRKYHALLRPAILTAWLGYAFVGLGLTFDLGRYWNIWRPVVNWQGNSVLFEVGMCVMAYLVVLTVEMAPALLEGLVARGEARGWDARFLRPLLKPARGLQRAVRLALPVFVVAGVVLSCMHQSSLGALMLIAPSKLSPLWWTPILPLLFLLSALMVGLPMVMVESILASRSFGRPTELAALAPLSRIIPWFVGLYGLIKVGDLVVRHGSLSLGEHPGDAVALGVELMMGVVIPFVMLLRPARRCSVRWLMTASLMIVAGVVLNRVNVFVVGFHPPYATTPYYPAIGELALTAGLVATLVLTYRFFANYFPVMEAGHVPGDAQEAEATGLLEPPDPAEQASARRWNWTVRGLAAAFLLGFVAFYTLVHETAEQGGTYETIAVTRVAQVWQKIPEIAQPERPRGYQTLYLLDNPVVNERADDYEPVLFPHRAHDAWSQANCAVCHHRHAKEEGDRQGQDVISMHRAAGEQIGGACSNCHGDQSDNPPQACSRCHGRPNEPDAPERPGLKAALHRQCMGCHEQLGAGKAPLDCNDCHHPNVPDHKAYLGLAAGAGPEEVTARCLKCHPESGREVLDSVHWRWEGASPATRGHENRVDLGLPNVVNNLRIYAGANMERCTNCHAGYGRAEANFDPRRAEAIDCLVCHDTTGRYTKDSARGGRPPADLDLTAIAEKVGRPNRANCGSCHFEVCTGPNEKHGDLGPELATPSPDTDVHMGLVGFNCQACHRTTDHRIAGQSLSYPPNEGRVACLDCHGEAPHALVEKTGDHLDTHVRHVACESCHIPSYARITPTVVLWDWSTAGGPRPADLPQDALHLHSPAEGTRVLGKDLVPAYQWYDGTHERYAVGQEIDPAIETQLNPPMGTRADPAARISPFKILEGKQPYDLGRKVLALPRWLPGLGEAVTWSESLRQGMAAAGQDFSGEFGFAPTRMYLGIEHEVQPADKALGCADCHRAELLACRRCHPGAQDLDAPALIRARYPERTGRLDFSALGYSGDPAEVGGRTRTLPLPPVQPPAPATP